MPASALSTTPTVTSRYAATAVSRGPLASKKMPEKNDSA